MALERIDSAMDLFIKRSLRNFHTSISGKVVAVNLAAPSVTVQPTPFTTFEGAYKDDVYPTLYDVPLHVLSAQQGKVHIGLPVAVGDDVTVHFSERNPNDNTDTSTHGLYTCYAIVGTNVSQAVTALSTTDLTLENDKARFTLKPSGEMEMKNASGKFTMMADGSFNINGLIISSDGKITDSAGITLNTHVHGGVAGGSSNTGTPK